MNIEQAEKEIKSIAELINELEKSISKSTSWFQVHYIHLTIADLELIKGKLDGLLKALKTDFKGYRGFV